jgi:regulator of sigma E protease
MPAPEWREMTRLIRQEAGKGEVSFTVRRGGEELSLRALIPYDAEHQTALLGITPARKRFSLPAAFGQSGVFLYQLCVDMFRGFFSWSVAGPVGIAGMAGEAARDGLWSFIMFLALINLNLGLLNLFPFPALDGGYLFFVLGEMILRRRLPERVEYYIHAAGFMILMCFILFVTWQDIVRLI